MQYFGEEASIEDLKNNLNSAVNGFQTITMNDNISDVIVKTNEGYLFEAYFDEVFSDYYVEYMGQVDPSYIPEINITYSEASGEIKVTASGNISKIIITQNEKEVNSTTSNTLSHTAANSGVYKISVLTKEGITRYGYVNVGLKKDKLKAPEIRVAAGNEGNNGWYKTDVNVEIDPANTNGQTMHYRLAGATTKSDTEITNMSSTTVEPVTSSGLTKVIAWVETEEDGKTYRSDYSYFNVKIDNKAPDAPTSKITATEGNQLEGNDVSQTNTYWYKTNVELEITANDDNSGVYGYTYSITGTKSVSETALIGKTQKITFETDGTYTLIIKAIDKAGNQSTPYTVTIYKDSTPPNPFTPNISNITNTSFTISAYTMDDISGIAKYEYYVNNDKKYEGTENTYTVTGLTKDTTYGVYVNAYDKAGNIQASSAISVYTAGSTAGGSTGGGNTGPDGSTIGYGTYTLFYDANGIPVTGLPASRTFAHGETFRITTDVPRSTQPGSNFLAWSTDTQATETLYYPGNEITGYGNITLYAIWTDKCTISYNANGGSVTPASQSFDKGYSIVLPSNAGEYAANPSATLLGWAYTADNNFVFYKPGDVYSDYNYGTCTLYAVWDLGITVNLDTNGGQYENTNADKVPLKFTFASGLGVNLPTDAGVYSRNTNITHFKWVLGSQTGSEYYDGPAGSYFSNTSANGQTLYAVWDNEIKYNKNGGTVDNSTVYLKYKESITLPSSAGIRSSDSNWLNTGWSKDSTTPSSSNYVTNGATYSTFAGSGITTTFYAVWTNKIAYNANGGTSTPTAQYLPYNGSITLASSAGNNSSAAYRAFRGWSTSSTATSGATGSYSTYGGNGVTTTLYAIWAPALKVGDYVAYSPAGASSSYSTNQSGDKSGGGAQTISQASLNWRVLSVSGSKISLVSETIPSGTLKLQGADGYNNGVKLLNDAANALYKNTTLGATGRNLNVDDVNGLMGVTPSTSLNSSYGTEYTPSNKYYPKIFQYEKWGSINGSYTGSLGFSQQSSWYSGSAQASTLKGKYSYYSYTLSTYKATSTVQHALATGQANSAGSTSHTTYWLASRCVHYFSSSRCFYFRMFSVGSGNVNADYLYRSLNSESSFSYAVRPVVDLTPSSLNIGASGSGTSASKYSISKK